VLYNTWVAWQEIGTANGVTAPTTIHKGKMIKQHLGVEE
jgi:hypothetical protein